jgi:phosphatidylglycerol:prolipoprotein diacylglycerol transferase
MYVHRIDPVIFSVGPFSVRYYGLAWVLAFVVAYLWIKNLTEELVSTYIFAVMVGSLLGSRFFHVFIFEPDHYLTSWEGVKRIFAIWHGGLAFHGGFAGLVVATWWFCRTYRLRYYDMADALVIPGAVAVFFGRIANFINAEMPGKLTNLPWGVDFSLTNPAYPGWRHPTVLYEALKNLLILFVLLQLWRRRDRLRPGVITWTFIGLYGFIRFWLMFLRDERTVWLGLTLSQIFSGLMALVAAAVFLTCFRQPKQKPAGENHTDRV